MKKVFMVFGTRPEAIKMAPVINQFKEKKHLFRTIVCVTAQHRHMLDQVLSIFDISPEYDLDIMRPGQDLFDVTCDILKELKKILIKEEPDLVLVQGDTTTTMAAALAAFYCKIKIGHIEAGLRTCNKYAPFPEEINRKVTGCIADLHFAPTPKAKESLEKEGVQSDRIWVTGNTVIDVLLDIIERFKTDKTLRRKLEKQFNFLDSSKKLILVTGHRRESFGRGFENICSALKEIGEKNQDVEIVYPVHLNPNVQKPVYQILRSQKNIYLVEPLEYLSFVFLMNRSYLILTDSGGIQEEAPSLKIPVLVMRDTTERPEALDVGAAKLVGVNKASIIKNVEELLTNRELYTSMLKSMNPYGDGQASKRIFAACRKYLLGRVIT